MEIITEKFDNFKNLIKSKVEEKDRNNILNLFLLSTVDWFISTVKKKKAANLTKEQILDEIFEVMELKQHKFSEEDITKLCRYLEYFGEVADTLN